MSQQRDNSGILSKNDFKKEDKHPDYRGNCMVNGVEMDLAAWIKTGKQGRKFMSLSFSAPKERATPESVARVKEEKARDFDDEVPF